MTKRLWVQTPAPYTVWMQAIFSLLHYKKLKIQVAKWGKPKKYLKKNNNNKNNNNNNNYIICSRVAICTPKKYLKQGSSYLY
jgi:hypothetical protein